MNKFTKWIVGALCALALVTSTFAATNTVATAKAPVQVTQAESWTLTLGGIGATTTTGNSQSAFGADLSLGRTGHLLLPVEAGVRQGFSYSSTDSTTLFDTHLFADWTLLTIAKRVDVFAGGNAGLAYGNQPLLWTAAPEAGVRVWIKKDVALVGRVDYPFNLNDGKSENTLRYFLGVRVNL